jgi:soluble lytic murein transglycosylase
LFKTFIKQIAVTILCLNFLGGNALAEELSQRLWGGLNKVDISNLKNLKKSISGNQYQEALEIAKEMNNSGFSDAAIRVALWNKYSNVFRKKSSIGSVAFSDVSRFVNDNPFFPNISDLRKSVENIARVKKIPYEYSRKYFDNFPAIEAESKLYVLESKIEYASHPEDNKEDNPEDLQNNIENLTVDIWINENFSAKDEIKYLSEYGDQLTEEDHIKRINRLFWDGKDSDAKRIFYLVGEDYQRLFAAIDALNEKSEYIKKIIRSIPRGLRDSEILAYRVISWKKHRIKNNSDLKEVVNMLLKIPSDVEYRQKWWSLRKLYAREMLKSKHYEKAYKLASSHGLKPGDSGFADAEWTAGWIALRFLKNPEIAYEKFNRFYLNVGYPISVSRGAYWLGMASEAMVDKEKAISWYKIASKYPTYFYGQLAIHKHRSLDDIGAHGEIILPKDPEILPEDLKFMAKNEAFKTAYLLALIGDRKNAANIFKYVIASSRTKGQITVVMRVVNELNDKGLDAKISREAAKKNVFFIKDKFQIIKSIRGDSHAALVHAIIKQESGFSVSALSSAGAIGFMQIMPDTAKFITKQIGIKFSKRKLARDMKYNVTLGSYYIKYLIEKFDGSEILAIASYNAGPNSTQRWINEFYDPRKDEDLDKVVDWIELITYSETRNYVQRIMENMIVYKYLMARENLKDFGSNF